MKYINTATETPALHISWIKLCPCVRLCFLYRQFSLLILSSINTKFNLTLSYIYSSCPPPPPPYYYYFSLFFEKNRTANMLSFISQRRTVFKHMCYHHIIYLYSQRQTLIRFLLPKWKKWNLNNIAIHPSTQHASTNQNPCMC